MGYRLFQKIWDSGIGLSSWMIELQENQSLVDTNPMLKDLYASLLSDRPRKILELGKLFLILWIIIPNIAIFMHRGWDRNALRRFGRHAVCVVFPR
jgi:hypothetical protein